MMVMIREINEPHFFLSLCFILDTMITRMAASSELINWYNDNDEGEDEGEAEDK